MKRIWLVLGLTGVVLTLFQLMRLDLLAVVPFSPDSAAMLQRYDEQRAVRMSQADRDQMMRYRALIIEGTDSESEENVRHVLTALQLDCDTRPAGAGEPAIDYDAYDLVVIPAQSASTQNDLELLSRYAEQGGRLFYLGLVPDQVEEPTIAGELLGIRHTGGIGETSEIHFNIELMPGITGPIRIGGNFMSPYTYFQSLEVDLNPECEVQLEAAAGNPLIWSRKAVNGQVMVMNLGRCASKELRGLMSGALALMFDFLPYPVIGSKVVFVDDFPADYRTAPELLRQQYGRGLQRFILEFWWPRMRLLMQRHGLKYTGAFIESYDANLTGPFAENAEIRKTSARLAGELLEAGGEISLHGRNHQPLFFDQARMGRYGYQAWPSAERMAAALRQSVQTFGRMYPGYAFAVYLPPSDLLQPEAISPLLEAVPTLRVISGVYYGSRTDDAGTNSDKFLQEFRLDDRYGIALPRATTGMHLTDEVRFLMASVLTTDGIISHFIHPDDVLDPTRSLGLDWDSLSESCALMFESWSQTYGWLSSDTASEAAVKLEKAAHAEVRFSEAAGRITIACDRFCESLSLMVVSDRPIKAGSDCRIQPAGHHRWLVTMLAPRITLEVETP